MNAMIIAMNAMIIALHINSCFVIMDIKGYFCFLLDLFATLSGGTCPLGPHRLIAYVNTDLLLILDSQYVYITSHKKRN